MDQQPTIGRIVVYRNRAGVDLPAIITAIATRPGCVHLTQFPPPGHGADQVSHEHGVPEEAASDTEPLTGHWRWPKRP